MAQTVVPAPRVVPPARRRAFFGLFNADGWPWATVKALGWFVTIIILIAYIPDRAYYFTVQKTVDIGVLIWSPINFCPPENETLPCPAPLGATLPWHPSPAEIEFPAGRSDGAAALIGTTYLYAGGSDGKAPVAAPTSRTWSVSATSTSGPRARPSRRRGPMPPTSSWATPCT